MITLLLLIIIASCLYFYGIIPVSFGGYLGSLLGSIVSVFAVIYSVEATRAEDAKRSESISRPNLYLSIEKRIDKTDSFFYTSFERLPNGYDGKFILIQNPTDKIAQNIILNFKDKNGNTIDIIQLDFIINNCFILVIKDIDLVHDILLSFEYNPSNAFGLDNSGCIKYVVTNNNINLDKEFWGEEAKKIHVSLIQEINNIDSIGKTQRMTFSEFNDLLSEKYYGKH